MDFKNILAKFDAVDNTAKVKSIAQPSKKDAMQSILESFDRVAEAAKPDFLDLDKDGNKKESMKKAVADKEDAKESVEEELEEAIMVSAEGDEAESLLQILKLSGMPTPPAPAAMPAIAAPAADLDTMDIEMQDEYSNSPDEFEQDVNAVIANGTDLHREKGQYPAAARGDNPMNAFEGKFKAILADLLKE